MINASAPLTQSQRVSIARDFIRHIVDQIHDAAYRDIVADDVTYKIVADCQSLIATDLNIVAQLLHDDVKTYADARIVADKYSPKYELALD